MENDIIPPKYTKEYYSYYGRLGAAKFKQMDVEKKNQRRQRISEATKRYWASLSAEQRQAWIKKQHTKPS